MRLKSQAASGRGQRVGDTVAMTVDRVRESTSTSANLSNEKMLCRKDQGRLIRMDSRWCCAV